MDRLSAVIIAQNEEQNLPACIESVSFADEILVCDGGSDDRTVDIAEALGATVVRREFDGFASQKNFIIDQAKGPWILSLDADERVTGELKDEIIELLSSSGPLADGYRMPRKGYFGGKWIRYGGWWPDYNLRLFRKGKGRFEEREVHESVNVEGEVETLSGPIEHNGENKRGKLSDIVLRPIFTFVKMYVFRQGFRDGYVGFQLAMLYAIYTFSKYAKVKEMSNKI
jgi:glycosyltransferase involved in cell wall biosynthesis